MAGTKASSKAAKKAAPQVPMPGDALELFHPVTAKWFRAVFEGVTPPQREGWPAIARGESTLILAPTGTGKTLTAFLWCLDRLMLREPSEVEGCRVVYISPLKALAVDVVRIWRSARGWRCMCRRSACAPAIPARKIARGSSGIRERF